MGNDEKGIKVKNKVKPFLRWTGSKSWFARNELERYVPSDYNSYYEPFVGGGAVFFNLRPKVAKINDLNEELINTYVQIKNNIDELVKELKLLENTKENYYLIRSTKIKNNVYRAARFIYLNRTSFNGIYRVNSKGEYNVPYGYRKNVDIITEDNLRFVSHVLLNVEITNLDFHSAIKDVKAKDFVYLDPPYTVAHENNGFIEYNSKLFSWEDQEKLAESIKILNDKGAYFILSNAEHDSIRCLYKGLGEVHPFSRYSRVGGRNKTRGVFNEVIITNIF